MRKLALVITGLLMFGATESFAATQGQIGATSTGTANININLPKLIRIRNMADLNFGTYSGSSDLSANQDVNVSVNYASAGYRVTASGSGASGAFTVADGAAVVPYSVKYNDQSGVTGSVAAVAGTALTGQTGAAKPLGSTTLNGNYEVKFLEPDLQGADAGNYSGVLTLVLAPE